jgi:hypothetical protein
MLWTVVAIVLIVGFVALLVWFATHREGNTADNLPEDSAGPNPPINGTGIWT